MNKQHTCSMQEKKKKTNQQTNKQDERRIETKLRNAGSSRFFLMRLAFGPLCACVCARMFERGDTCSGLTFTNNTTTPPPAYERNRTNKRKTHREREREREREGERERERESTAYFCCAKIRILSVDSSLLSSVISLRNNLMPCTQKTRHSAHQHKSGDLRQNMQGGENTYTHTHTHNTTHHKETPRKSTSYVCNQINSHGRRRPPCWNVTQAL